MFKEWPRRLMVASFAGKAVLGALLASHFLHALFVPFLNLAIGHAGTNPWQEAIDQGIPNAFPYGPVMFYIMAFPRWLFGWAMTGDSRAVTWIHLLVARLPLLLADISLLWLLVQGLKSDVLRTGVLWWTSPVVIYVTYIHGQLDLIPTALLIGSLALMFHGRLGWSAIVLGLGLATKNHLFVALPFMCTFVLRKESSWRRGAQYLVLVLSTYVASLFPWVLNPGFRQMVFHSEEQRRLFPVLLDYLPTLKVYLAPFAIGLLFLQFASYRKVTQDTLLMYLGLAYTVLITLVPAAHGYFIWPLPFVIYFFSQQTRSSRVPLWAFNISCLAYLILGLDSTFFESLRFVAPRLAALGAPVLGVVALGLQPTVINSLLYTALLVSVLAIAGMMYRHGVQSNILYRPLTRPILFGIGGDSGAGKHTAQNILCDVLGSRNVLSVNGDDVHRWARGHEMWQAMSHLNPAANDLYVLLQHARALGQGQTVTKARYDHRAGNFTKPTRVSPSRFVFIVGLHSFYLKRMREIIDVKIYLDPDEDLRIGWKTARDVRERGYSEGQVLDQIRKREPDAVQFVRPQREVADIVIRYFRVPPKNGAETGDSIGISVRVDNGLPMSSVVDELSSPETKVSLQHCDDLMHQILTVEGHLREEQIAAAAWKVIPQLNELIASKPKWHSGPNGVLQLCSMIVLSDALRGLDSGLG